MTSAADELRAAADLMLERAQAAAPGPWDSHADGLVWAPRLGDPVSGSTDVEDAAHIASWHPLVAAAVASWLADAAAWFAHHARSGSTDLERRYRLPLAVAHAYLGTSKDSPATSRSGEVVTVDAHSVTAGGGKGVAPGAVGVPQVPGATGPAPKCVCGAMRDCRCGATWDDSPHGNDECTCAGCEKCCLCGAP